MNTKGAYPFAAKEEQYKGLSDEALLWSAMDARDAMQACAGHNGPAEAWYADDLATILKEIRSRKEARTKILG